MGEEEGEGVLGHGLLLADLVPEPLHTARAGLSVEFIVAHSPNLSLQDLFCTSSPSLIFPLQ